MKEGHRVKVVSLDYLIDSETQEPIKRKKSFIGKEGTIKDINLGVFKVKFDDGSVEYFDGREIEFSERLLRRKAQWVFVSWQKDGKSVYNTEEGEHLFWGDLNRGVTFQGSIDLSDEEIMRIKEAEEKGIRPVFDLYLIEEERRKHRRKIKE